MSRVSRMRGGPVAGFRMVVFAVHVLGVSVVLHEKAPNAR